MRYFLLLPYLFVFTTFPSRDKCANVGQWEQAASFLAKMKENAGTLPDKRTYSSVIDACSKAENWEKAIFFLNEMLKSRLP